MGERRAALEVAFQRTINCGSRRVAFIVEIPPRVPVDIIEIYFLQDSDEVSTQDRHHGQLPLQPTQNGCVGHTPCIHVRCSRGKGLSGNRIAEYRFCTAR